MAGIIGHGVDQRDEPKRALEADMIETRGIEVDFAVLADLVETAQIGPIDGAIVDFLSPGPGPFGARPWE